MQHVRHRCGWYLVLCVLAVSWLSACTTEHATRAPDAPTAAPPVQYGLASWYGRERHGRRTASGEPFNMYRLTAAHRTVPFGTYALVTNLENGQQVRVRINDRGPALASRLLDLSYAAAQQLDIVRPGRARIKVEFDGLVP